MLRERFVQGALLLLVPGLMSYYHVNSFNPGESCDDIAAWVAELRDDLPRSLAELSVLPLAYHRAAYAALPNETRVAIWVEHIDEILASNGGLEPEQVRFVSEVLDNFDQYFDVGAGARREDLQARATTVLGAKIGRAMFATLGPDAVSDEVAGIKCSCSTSSDWCGSGYNCTSANCDQTSIGCGTLWMYSCDGVCWDGTIVPPED